MPSLPIPPPHPSQTHLHPPPWFCPCVLYSSSCSPLSSLSPPYSSLAIVRLFLTSMSLVIFCLHTEGPETYEKMLSITSHQRDANSNHNEVLSHTGQSGQHKQIHKQMLERMWRKGNPSALLVGIQTGVARYIPLKLVSFKKDFKK